ncbi:MAG: TdeIII family type II restriction endonuclease [Marinifilaceae bacterium]|jgi:hypothetical protein|nr:TdeIII family type II restriction endonuclease [Marinifilaceae bacterium]
MLTEKKAKQIIKSTAKESIISFAEKAIKKKPKFQILDLIIPKERKIRSIVGGLETSLGTTLWEPLAKALASENGFEVIDANLESPVNIPSNLHNTLQYIIDERKRKSGIFDANSSHDEIKKVCQVFVNRPIDKFEQAPKGRGVDIWLRKENIDYFFDTKTVQPNLSALVSCMEQVLNWYSYYYSKYPNNNAVARIVFPYNPHNGEFWDKTIGKGEPLEKHNEAWVENEFWNFCSGLDDTYSLITQAFEELKDSKELESSIHQMLD